MKMAKFRKIIRENSEYFLIKKFIRLFKEKIKNTKKKRFSFVLTGGESPINLYKNISREKGIPWKKIDFFIGDERYVNEKSENSNIRMCRKYLLYPKKISENQIYKIDINNKGIAKNTDNYEKKLNKYFNNKKVSFDLILLGIGNDGHIASLFKNNINNKSKKNVDFVKKKDFLRITLTLKCINNCKSIFLWAPDKKKSSIVKKILSDKKLKYPASFLRVKNNFLFHSN